MQMYTRAVDVGFVVFNEETGKIKTVDSLAKKFVEESKKEFLDILDAEDRQDVKALVKILDRYKECADEPIVKAMVRQCNPAAQQALAEMLAEKEEAAKAKKL